MARLRTVLQLAILAAAAVVLVTAPATGSARSTRPWRSIPTQIFVSEHLPAIHGALHSPSRYCSARRRLLVYRPRPGADHLVGRGWSHRSGAWRVSLGEKLEKGHYYVIAPARSSRQLRIHCPQARSKSIPVV